MDVSLIFIITSEKRLRLGEKTGYEKREKVNSTKNVVSTFYDDAHQTSIFYFCPRKYAIITRKSIRKGKQHLVLRDVGPMAETKLIVF